MRRCLSLSLSLLLLLRVPVVHAQGDAKTRAIPPAAPVVPVSGDIPAPGQVGIISAGMSVHGRLEPGDMMMTDSTYADIWRFEATAGQHVRIELRSDEFDTYLQLLDTQYNVLAEDDDSLGDLNSVIEFTIPTTGTYQVVVNNYEGDRKAGVYTLTLR